MKLSILFITIVLITVTFASAKLHRIHSIRNVQACAPNYSACGDACYNKSTYRCFGSQLCSINNRRCAGNCYEVAAYNCNSNKLCQINRPSCGDSCYDPLAYTCSGGTLHPRNGANLACGSTSCPANRACCTVFNGARCYDPNTQACVDLENATYHAVCPKGKIACALRGGTVCINPSLYYCDYVISPMTGSICRVGSYNPTTNTGPTCNIACTAPNCVPAQP
jgi:hypothetical protein